MQSAVQFMLRQIYKQDDEFRSLCCRSETTQLLILTTQGM